MNLRRTVMSIEAIRPSTLDGIKRLAKVIKVRQHIQHARALDEAAKHAGFQNFRHAQNQLTKNPTPGPSHHVFVTAYWRDRDTGANGRETKVVELSALLGDLITRAQLRYDRSLGLYKLEGPDHLVRRHVSSSQSLARDAVMAAERTLHFIDATKLRPSRSERGDISSGLPGRDHHSVWIDAATKRHLITDEPYERAVEGRTYHERVEWAGERGFRIVKSTWPGMYNPDGESRLFLVADSTKGVPLDGIEAALARLPAPSTVWDGISAPAKPAFRTPASLALAASRPKRTAVKRGSSGPRNSLGYSMVMTGRSRRPKATLPLQVHEELGRLIKSVFRATYHRKGVYNRLNSVRCTLDDWTQCEYPRDSSLTLDQLNNIYYRESQQSFVRHATTDERHGHIEALERAKSILTDHYPACVPLREVVGKLDGAIKSLQRWE
jgi:hypothetical protein